jgi:phage gp16-like protein
MGILMTKEQKFLSKIVKNTNTNGCWQLTSDDGTKYKDVFYFKRKGFKAKRFSYEYFNGKVKAGLKVLCKCANKLCINPDHHFAGTGTDQINLLFARGWKHRRGWKQKPEVLEKMSKVHKGKIIPPEMREKLRQANLGKKHTLATRKKMSRNRIGIRVKEEARIKIALSKQGEKNYNTRLTVGDIKNIRKMQDKMTIMAVADRFGISYVHVVNIWNRKVWKHVK